MVYSKHQACRIRTGFIIAISQGECGCSNFPIDSISIHSIWIWSMSNIFVDRYLSSRERCVRPGWLLAASEAWAGQQRRQAAWLQRSLSLTHLAPVRCNISTQRKLENDSQRSSILSSYHASRSISCTTQEHVLSIPFQEETRQRLKKIPTSRAFQHFQLRTGKRQN